MKHSPKGLLLDLIISLAKRRREKLVSLIDVCSEEMTILYDFLAFDCRHIRDETGLIDATRCDASVCFQTDY